MADILGYQVDIDAMKPSTCGMIGIARKNGRKYFCKQFNTPVLPGNSKAISEKTARKNTALFEAFRTRKQRVNAVLREIAGIGGNIVFPIQETVYNNHWMEFTEYIEGAIPENRYFTTIAGLSEDKKLLALKIAIGALSTLHNQRLIHGDLKLTNIMLVKNSSGNYVSKIIDFDGAFFEDDVPADSIIGTMDYYSPELAIYSDCEDPETRAKLSKYITTKSDIFTMGLVLHEYLAGEKPQPDALPSALQKLKNAGKFIYPWQILLTRDKGKPPCQLVISGKIKEPAYVALISDMLALEPEQRPTAAEVMSRLNNRKLQIDTEPWPGDAILIIPEIVRKSAVALRKVADGEARLYEVVLSDGRRYRRTARELVDTGVAFSKGAGGAWPAPNPKDGIEWDLERIQKSFVSMLPPKEAGMYELVDKNGVVRKMNCNQLKLLRFAKPVSAASATVSETLKPIPEGPGPISPTLKPPSGATKPVSAPPESAYVSAPVTPPSSLRPKDAALYALNGAHLMRNGIRFVGPDALNGVEGYRFRMSDGREIFMTPQNCQMASFFQKR